MPPRFAHVGGNSNNGARVGAWYVNLNNDAANRNWNIGASLLIPKWYYNTCTVSSFPLGKNEPVCKHPLVAARTKRVRG